MNGEVRQYFFWRPRTCQEKVNTIKIIGRGKTQQAKQPFINAKWSHYHQGKQNPDNKCDRWEKNKTGKNRNIGKAYRRCSG